MSPSRVLLAAIVAAVSLSPSPAAAQSPPPDGSPVLSQTLRDLLLRHLPDPIVESNRHWGQQKEPRFGPRRGLRNDGHWQRVKVEAIDPAKSLVLAINGLATPEPGKTTFDAYLGLDTRLTYEQQVWKAGRRLYGGSTRARCRAALKLSCELTSRLEAKPGAVLPDAVVRVRVVHAGLNYTDLVVEHTAGLDGEAARKVGELVHKFLGQMKPNLERDLLAKANAAIVKAADTKEVRVALDQLLSGKPPTVTRMK
jgi:hypothetical protein